MVLSLTVRFGFFFPLPTDEAEMDPPDLLNMEKCLEYLAALRHAKWFQVIWNSQLKLYSHYELEVA